MSTPPFDRRLQLAGIAVLIVTSAIFAVVTGRRRPAPPRTSPAAATSAGAIVIGATGDSAVVAPLPARDPKLQAVAAVLRRSSVAITNFELTLLAGAPPPNPDEEPRWPPAAPAAPDDLRALGITAVSLANNHTGDYGIDGLRDTERLLDRAGLAHAGTGENLEQARAPVYLDTPAGRVALIAVAVSHAPMSRAAPARGDIKGRPGLSPLRYTRRITLDAPTFNSLKRSFPAGAGEQGIRRTGDNQLDLFGTNVVRGDRNAVELVANPGDVSELLDAVRQARQRATVVVVSVHAHEPGNVVDEVPDLLRDFAHEAIDAGADLIVGHGPHRLRGVEIYKDRPVLYSLGNFIFQDRGFEPAAADVFEDASQNLLAGWTSSSDTSRAVLDFSDHVWWESAVALARFERGRFARLELHPIDLGAGETRATRGVPRVASPALAAKILSRLQALSRPFGATIQMRDGIGVVLP